MKIAISADGSNLNAKVGHKFGASQYLVIVDVETGDFEAMPNPGASGQGALACKPLCSLLAKVLKQF